MDTETTPKPATRTYFRATTTSQRRLLFQTVADGANVTAAARRAHVGRGTYYYWRDRYAAAGEAGLAQPRSCAPHHPRLAPISAELRAEVLAQYDAQPHERGCRMIAERLRQAHHGQRVIGHSAVAEIIRTARPAPGAADTRPVDNPVTPAPPRPGPADGNAALSVPGAGEPGGVAAGAAQTTAVARECPRDGKADTAATTAGQTSPGVVVHAPAPHLTANIDLCVVPVTHDGRQPWAAASVSAAAAGATPEVSAAAATPSPWPGQVFGDPARPYAEQMQAYHAQRTAKRTAQGQRKHRRRQKQTARRALAIQSDELRVARRRRRQARRQEDATWGQHRVAHRAAVHEHQQQSRTARRASRAQWRQTTEAWAKTRTARQQQVERRTTEDAAWRASRQEIRSQLAALAALPLITVWLAILVVIDNGTRRCLQLPLFVTGVHVTAEEIVAQLRAHWPRDLQFVISDNGAQFIAEVFAQFAKEMEFLHIRIAPHRPQTNGIAERFVRTLKEWLAWHSWQSAEELAALLAEFIIYYNDRPHQGAELAGLSPNEFARRLECSTC